jgi:4-amino-4-deoxy-L-arabinose transferase-like glycosyltransferase
MRNTFRFDLRTLAALGLAFFVFAAAITINRTVFERLPHLEDEFAYLYQAKIFARGQAWVPRNEPVKVYWQPFIIQPERADGGDQKRFGKYTPGWPLLLAPGAAIDAPWVMNAFFGMLTLLLTYRLGREIFDPTIGLIAALLLAISPMALLLNASLMSHTSTMFLAALFLLSYWRIYRGSKQRVLWGVVGGLTLGLIVSSRPLTAVAVALPLMIHAAGQLFDDMTRQWQRFLRLLIPLLVLSVCVLPTAALWPIFNQIWTGDWRTNVYTLQWPYDRVGFGIGYGPNQQEGHTLAKGWRNAREDLKFYWRDLFGFTVDSSFTDYAAQNWGWGWGSGLAWALILLGLVRGWRNEWVWLMAQILAALVIGQLFYWIGSSVNGAAAYSVRYYYEATFAICLLCAYGIASAVRALHRLPATPVVVSAHAEQYGATVDTRTINYLNGVQDRQGRVSVPSGTTFESRFVRAWQSFPTGYAVLLVACGLSLAGFTPARFKQPLPPQWDLGLFRYNKIGQPQLDAIAAARQQLPDPTKPLLIVVLHHPDKSIADNWRDYAAAMSRTSPFLDSDIVVARLFDKEDIPEYLRRFPNRSVLYQIGEQLSPSVEIALLRASGTTTTGKAP